MVHLGGFGTCVVPSGITVNNLLSNVVCVVDVLVLIVNALLPGTYDTPLLPPPKAFANPPLFKLIATPQ